MARIRSARPWSACDLETTSVCAESSTCKWSAVCATDSDVLYAQRQQQIAKTRGMMNLFYWSHHSICVEGCLNSDQASELAEKLLWEWHVLIRQEPHSCAWAQHSSSNTWQSRLLQSYSCPDLSYTRQLCLWLSLSRRYGRFCLGGQRPVHVSLLNCTSAQYAQQIRFSFLCSGLTTLSSTWYSIFLHSFSCPRLSCDKFLNAYSRRYGMFSLGGQLPADWSLLRFTCAEQTRSWWLRWSSTVLIK